MLDSFPVILAVGTVLGFLAGIGVGGGSLLILWLTIVLNVSHCAARSINLLFFIPSAIIACFFRWRQGALKWEYVLPAILAGCISAGVFSWLSSILDTGFLKKAFGVLLLLTGIRELLYKPKETRRS